MSDATPYGPLTKIDLYFANTPNGQKIAIGCEEMGVPYNLHRISFKNNEQLTPAYLAINPNNKIPAIVDPTGPGGEPFTLFESGAILQYLGNKTGRLYPTEPRARALCEQWLFWQMGGLGPMGGQANHFVKFATEKVPYAIERFMTEVKRLYNVLEGQLTKHEYMAGDYSIADIATYPWIMAHGFIGLELAAYPQISRWVAAIGSREGVRRAAAV